MTMTCMIIRTTFLGLGVIALSGCDWVGMFAKEAVIGATSHRGWDTFTFTGQLPANFGIDAIAFYGPDNPHAVNCQGPTFEIGKTVRRSYAKKYTADIQAQPQVFGFEIPLSYYKGLCGMKLGRVKLEINARYGEQKWQQTYADGNLWIEADGTSKFNSTEAFGIATRCSFTFKVSSLNFGIDKFLTCISKGASLSREELANKTVSLSVSVSLEERPSERNRWINIDAGWKPCQGTEKSDRCQNPPVFKTFKMNGQTCTVYPGCTE